MPKARSKALPPKSALPKGKKSIDAIKKRQRCLELRAEGLSIRAIADLVKLSHQQVHDNLRAELGNILASMTELGERIIALHNERLDYIQDQMIQQLHGEKGPAAAQACISAMREQQRLFRLDLTPKGEGDSEKPRAFGYVTTTGEQVVLDGR
jgi:DNA-binding transcriptional MerR regulator